MKLKDFEKKKIIKDLERRYEDSRSNQRNLRLKWDKIEAYVAGYQIQDPGTGKYKSHEWAGAKSETENVDDEHLIVNDIRRVYLSNQQRLTAYSITPKVVPVNKENQNKVAARMGTFFLADVIRRHDEEKLKKQIATIMGQYGPVFLKASFDPTKGEKIRQPTRKMFEKFKAWVLGDQVGSEGEFVLDVISPRNIILPRYCADLSKADWVMELHVVTCDYVYRRYKKTVAGENIRPDETQMMGDWKASDVSANKEGGEGEEADIDRVLLKECHYRPCPRFPKGAIFVWANGELLRSTNLLDYYTDIPYFTAEMIYDHRNVFGDSILWDLIPEQDMVNKTASAMLRYMEMIGQLRRWIPREAEVTEEQLDNATSMNSVYSGAKPPEYEVLPELKSTIFEVNNLFRDYMASHGFSNELAKLKKAISGNAIGALQEIDDTVMRPALKSVQTMLTEACRFILRNSPRYVTEAKLCKMSNMQGWQVETFIASQLNGNFDAEINLMTGIPSGKVLRLEFLKGMYKDGLLDKTQVLNYMEMGLDDQAMEDIQKENEVADTVVQNLLAFPDMYHEVYNLRDNKLMYVAGVVPHEFDNHALLARKLELCMREGFDHWNTWVKRGFLENWQYHKRMDLQAQQQAAMLQAGPGAGGPGPGGPGGPGAGAPGGAFPGPPEPWSMASQDSFQDPSQQPDRDMVPVPLASGFQNN